MLAPNRNIRHIQFNEKGDRVVTLFISINDVECPGYSEKEIPKHLIHEFVPFEKKEKPKKNKK